MSLFEARGSVYTDDVLATGDLFVVDSELPVGHDLYTHWCVAAAAVLPVGSRGVIGVGWWNHIGEGQVTGVTRDASTDTLRSFEASYVGTTVTIGATTPYEFNDNMLAVIDAGYSLDTARLMLGEWAYPSIASAPFWKDFVNTAELRGGSTTPDLDLGIEPDDETVSITAAIETNNYTDPTATEIEAEYSEEILPFSPAAGAATDTTISALGVLARVESLYGYSFNEEPASSYFELGITIFFPDFLYGDDYSNIEIELLDAGGTSIAVFTDLSVLARDGGTSLSKYIELPSSPLGIFLPEGEEKTFLVRVTGVVL